MSISMNYPASTLAKLLNLTERRIQQLAKDGIIPKGNRGQYALVPCVQSYVKYLQERSERPVRLEGEGLQEERKRLLKTQADIAECEYLEKRNQFISLSVFSQILEEIAAVFTASIDAIPGKFSQELINISNPAVMKSKLFDECRRIRNCTAETLQRLVEEYSRRAESSDTDYGVTATHTR